jgi:molybdopterin synthase catalytic subunit
MAIVQQETFSIEDLIKSLRANNPSIGAVVTFTGYVREFDPNKTNKKLSKLHIEHYPEMTIKALIKIEQYAKKNWNITAVQIIHRYGLLELNEPIVGVIVLSEHRDEAFDACRFVIDYLKTEAPFWKKELTSKGGYWVERKVGDESNTKKWQSKLQDCKTKVS